MEREQATREPALVKEELHDLLAYLDGLPAPMKRNGAFASYEQRAAELSRELLISRMMRLEPRLVARSTDLGNDASAHRYVVLRDGLAGLERDYERSAKRRWLVARAIPWTMVVVSLAIVAPGWTPPGSRLLGIHFALFVFALCVVVSFEWAARAAWGKQLRAERVNALLCQFSAFLGPRGEILRLSEYYPANTRRIEQLLDELVPPTDRPGGRPNGHRQ